MKRWKPYSPDVIIKKICGCLLVNTPQTPASIAKQIHVNPKTVQKYVEITKNLGLLKYTIVFMGKKKIQVCSINPPYIDIFKNL